MLHVRRRRLDYRNAEYSCRAPTAPVATALEVTPFLAYHAELAHMMAAMMAAMARWTGRSRGAGSLDQA